MLRTFRHLFDYYCYNNVAFSGGPQPLKLSDGSLIGYIEKFEFSGGVVSISGWSLLDGLFIATSNSQNWVRRRQHRGDVVTELGFARMAATGNDDGRVGFSMEFEWREGGGYLYVSDKGSLFITGPCRSRLKSSAMWLLYMQLAHL